ncbi:MAG: 2-oxoglutarate oxidoreductase [Nitrospirae bacterium]|nr:2-oxoglutarate oxidoreductase [Nitrospirota bacterium]
MYGLKQDWGQRTPPRYFFLEDYVSDVPRWCSGCGDHSVLGALQRLARDEQLAPEKTVVVSGIGCSSRLPHYMKTYGFHGLHGRALPIACGVRSRRPDLDVFVITGDGDCCAIGTGHWIHAIRYNMKMAVMLLDNNIYGLTKKQTSPTTKLKGRSNTHPDGSPLDPINPLSVTLSVANVSFVAQTIDWNPPHLYATLQAAHRHPGFAFVRVLQRCPHYTPEVFEPVQKDRSLVLYLSHKKGIQVDGAVSKLFKNQAEHDPSNLAAARAVAERADAYPIGLLYQKPETPRYDLLSARGLDTPPAARIQAINRLLDSFQI